LSVAAIQEYCKPKTTDIGFIILLRLLIAIEKVARLCAALAFSIAIFDSDQSRQH
jgi:hypothetical protein